MDATDPRAQALETIALLRRRLEDVAFFEGRVFALPPEAAAPPPAATPERAVTLEGFQQEICQCTRCPLGQRRQHFVFGEGALGGIAFIGEAPGADEDRSGRPFVGAAGQLLDRIIEAMKLQRQEVYICNILKCRPPNNRNPQPDEIAQCLPYLKRQIALVRPKVICLLGRVAAHTLLQTGASMASLRQGQWEWEGIPVIPTYHPAALLRNEQYKRPVWEDVKRLRRLYDGVEL